MILSSQLFHCISVCFTIIAAWIFTTGFFPDVGQSAGTIGSDKSIADRRCSNRKTVLLLIDAMRLDMIFSEAGTGKSAMPFLSSASRWPTKINGVGGSFSAIVKVQAPTVTLPRIKCLTTGRVPGFLDVLWNFFATELATDSIVRRWRAANRSVHFYGDDTWTRMFPDGFARAEGVPSFFATDFYEVDNNVTRNLHKALRAITTWDALILHYLGLDHIGHIEGPNSRLVPAKLAEMDAAIESIVTALIGQAADWLLVVTSDHGMSDLGGHGGASLAETQTPLVLLTSARLTSDQRSKLPELQQTDLANLLSSWTGVQPPRASLGLLHPALVGLACNGGGGSVSTSLLSNNWLDLLELEAETNRKSDGFNRTEWSKRCAKDPADCYSAARHAQQVLVYAAAEYSLTRMTIGLALGCLCCLVRLPAFWPTEGLMNRLNWLDDGAPAESRLNSVTFGLLTVGTCLAPLLIHASTSLIEEEHQLWYFACTSLFVGRLLSACLPQQGANMQSLVEFLRQLILPLLPLAAFRLSRLFNQTGNKWAHLPDLNQHLRSWPICYAILLTISICLVGRFVHNLPKITFLHDATYRPGNNNSSSISGICLTNFRRFILIGCCCCAIWLRCRQVVLDIIDPLYSCLGLLLAAVWTAAGIIGSKSAAIASAAGGILLCQLVLASRPGNCAVLCLHCLAIAPIFVRFLTPSSTGPDAKRFSGVRYQLVLILGFVWLGQALYFQLGQSNSLATADIAASFAGLPFNSMSLSGGLLTLSTWSGQLFYLLLLILILRGEPRIGGMFKRTSTVIGLVHLLASYSWCSLAMFCIVQRHHLFVWTVYAPKYCYNSAYLALLTVLYLFAKIFD